MVAKIKQMWGQFDLDAWLASMGITYTLPVYAALVCGLGFAIGFLFKKYFKYLFIAIIFTALFVKMAEYNQIVSIDWVAARTFVGLEPHATPSTMVNALFEWIKENIVIFVSGIVGFLIGYKLG